MATTPRWGLHYPEGTDAPDVPLWMQELATDLDDVAKDDQGTLALRPSAGKRGSYYYATDTGRLFRDNGTSWDEISIASSISAAIHQPGDMKATARATAPTGWLLCDGSNVSRSTYAALFAAIGTNFGGGDGSTTFGLPDMRGRVPVGVDGSAGRLSAADALGSSGGEEKHTLSITEMPAHNHGGATGANTAPFGTNVPLGNSWTGVTVSTATLGGTIPEVVSGGLAQASATGEHDHGITSQGGGGQHNNLQPYQVVNWMVKT